MRHQLPPLPAAIRSLHDTEKARLQDKQVIRGDIDVWCPTCEGAKVIRWWPPGPRAGAEPVEYDCPCTDQYKLWRFFGYFGPPEQYGQMSWDDAWGVNDVSKRFIEEYLTELDYHVRQNNGLVLRGLRGSGKSLMASLVYRQFLARGYTGFWATWNDMLNMYTAGWRNEEERTWFDQTVRLAQVLVIDDIGQETPGRTATVGQSALEAMFRSRVQGKKVTLFTTNLDMADFEARYTSGIISLINECCTVHDFVGNDMRAEYQHFKAIERKLRLTRPLTIG